VCRYLTSIQLRSKQSKDGNSGLRVPSSLPTVAFYAFHAQTVVAACASLPIFIFYAYSLRVPFAAVRLGPVQLFTYFYNVPSSAGTPVARGSLLYRSVYAFDPYRGLVSMPSSVFRARCRILRSWASSGRFSQRKC